MQVSIDTDRAAATLSVTGDEWTESTSSVTFERYDGTRYVSLPGGTNIQALGGYATYLDVEMPLGQRPKYRATNEHGQRIEAVAAEIETLTNLIPNPRGRDTDGTVTVMENLITNPRGRNTSGTVVVRENLIPNPSFEYGTSSWITPPTITLTREGATRDGHEGNYEGRLSPSSAGSAPASTYWASTSLMPVTEGKAYSVQAKCSRTGNQTPATVDVMLRWYDSDGALVGTGWQANVSTLAGSPASHNVAVGENIIAPAGVTHARLQWVGDGTDTSGWSDGSLIIDAHMLVQGATIGDYFDGDTSPDTDLTPVWTSTAGASTSQLTAPVPVGWTITGTGYYSAKHDAIALRASADRPSRPYIVGGGAYTTNACTMLAEIVDTSDSLPVTMDIYRLNPKDSTIQAAGPGETIRNGVTADSTGGFVWLAETDLADRTVYFRAGNIDGTDSYAGDFWDGHTETWDPDLTVAFSGAVDASSSVVTAPKPVGWVTANGICYYSASQDALAFTVRAAAGQLSAIYCTVQPGPDQYITGLTEVIAAPSDAPWSVAFTIPGDPIVGPGEQRVGMYLPEGSTGYAPYYPVILSDADDAVANSGATYYFRAAIILGTDKYGGSFWDGHSPNSADVKHSFTGAVDASPSKRVLRDWSKYDGIEWGLWLKSRKAPELTTRIEWQEVGDLISTTQGAVYEVHGGPGIGQFGGVAPERFPIYGWVDGRIAYNRLRELLKSDRQLFIQTGEPKEFDDGWVQVRSVSFPNVENRLIEAGSGMRYVRMDCTRIEAPVGAPRGALGAPYRTLYTTYDSYQELTDSGLTYGDLLEAR